MTTADLGAVLALTRLVPEAPWWSEAHVAQIIGPDPPVDGRIEPQVRRGWVAVSGRVAGFIVLHTLRIAGGSRIEMECEIESIVVHPDFRRRGFGRALLDVSLSWCRRQEGSIIRLEVRSRNTSAIGLYQRAGFAAIGTRPAYYHAPEDDAILMALDLQPECLHG